MSDPASAPGRIIVGVTGGSGARLAVRLLEALAGAGREVHLVVSGAGQKVLAHETGRTPEDLAALGGERSHLHRPEDLFAPMASGSFRAEGMVIVPCSMKTLAGVAAGYADDLLLRAADVCLKERRRLILVARESPLSLIHIENMRRVTLAGAVVLPPVLTCYTSPAPTSLDEVVDQITARVLDQLGVEANLGRRWGEAQ
jgi:polyprenyl P-hydroxybenzoate/phenylacrylic acid decarboxylase-like protein